MDLIIPPPGELSADRTFTLTPGELFESIPLTPGGVDAFVDANLPKSLQRALPADPDVASFAEMIARQAAIELGMRGVIGLQWFTCEQSNRPTMWLDKRLGIGAHSRLDGFATAHETQPPSIWLRLDGRQVTTAELTHLIRHEIAHLYLEIRGMPSGPVHEALADTFADGGMPALARSFGLADSPPLLALSPGNASSTVIIDGTSDMFKIVATGTLSCAAPDAGEQTADGANLATGLTYVPVNKWWVQMGSGDVPCNYYVWNPSGGAIDWSYEGWANLIYTNQTSVGAYQTRMSSAPADYGRTFRYYVCKEAAI